MNPWKNISSNDYDGHMGDPSVDQLSFLADFFEESINNTTPESILLAGCATGNGLERTIGKSIKRVVAMDINKDFLLCVKERFSSLSNLDIQEASVLNPINGKFSFIFAGLLLEYVDVKTAIVNFYNALYDKGTLAVVIQLESATLQSVSPTRFESLKALSSIMSHIQPDNLKEIAKEVGFICVFEKSVKLASGKEFSLFRFRK